ncbi:MAG: hypothetical protein AAB403_13120 [Planctomycetota bacterium]
MTREQLIARNDTLRTQFRGGKILMDTSVWHVSSQVRARAAYRMTRHFDFPKESNHDYGEFVFAGYSWRWQIESFAGELFLTLSIEEDLLMEVV